jgi:hypothetical protein
MHEIFVRYNSAKQQLSIVLYGKILMLLFCEHLLLCKVWLNYAMNKRTLKLLVFYMLMFSVVR